MAIEIKRGCGYRKVGGLYLVGGYINVPCDRLPLPLASCPVCGGGIHFTRSITEINPLKLFGTHDELVPVFTQEPERSMVGPGTVIKRNCFVQFRPCHICDPPDEVAYIMMVGEKFYSPSEFITEAGLMGVSKRIPFVPKKLIVGKTIVYLAHPKAVEVKQPVAVQQAMALLEDSQPEPTRLLDSEKAERKLGIFSAFIPQRIEKLIWKSEAIEETLADLAKRRITPVIIPDGDSDHAPRKDSDHD